MAKLVQLKCGHKVDVNRFQVVRLAIDGGYGPRFALRGSHDSTTGVGKGCLDEVMVSVRHRAPRFDWLYNKANEGVSRALDGCRVELDGDCPHAFPSWHKLLGVV